MLNRLTTDDNYENSQQQYSARSYHLMQPVSIIQPTQSILSVNDRDLPPFPTRDPRLDDRHVFNEPLPVITDSATNDENSQMFHGSPAKRRRSTANKNSTALSAPPIRKRFNPALQSTGASQLCSPANLTSSSISRTPITTSKSAPDTTQYVLAVAQTIKPLLKLCEETNQLTKEILAQNEQHTRLLSELTNAPRELDKLTQQLSYILHLQSKTLQMQQHNDEENCVKVLNGVDLSQVSPGTSLNSTARTLMRTAFGETASFNDLRKGEFDVLLGLIAHIHGQNVSSVFANAYSIKNSLQQMKHDANKKGPLSTLKNTILKKKKSSTVHEKSVQIDEDEEDEEESQ